MPTKTAHIDTATHHALKQLAISRNIKLTELINDILKQAVKDAS